jgi:polyphosphate kinase
MAMGMSGDYSHWALGADGRWSRHHLDDEGQPLPDLQSALIELHAKRRRKARRR